MSSLSLFADGGRPSGSPFTQPDLIFGTVMLAGALLVGAGVVYVMDKWRKRATLPEQDQTGADLSGFRAMYQRGELTEEEYARLRQKVAARVKPAPAAPPTGDAPGGATLPGPDVPASTPPPPEPPPPA